MKRSAPQDQLLPRSIVSPSLPIIYPYDENCNVKPIVSPPFTFKTPSSQESDPSSNGMNVSDFLTTVKHEIMEIYQSLSENSDIDDKTASSKEVEATLVHMRKTNDALMSTLRKTYIHAKHLQEENDHLKMSKMTMASPKTCEKLCTKEQFHSDLKGKMDMGDDYIKRAYPDVITSPGTVSCVI